MMRRFVKLIAVGWVLLVMTTGCWDLKDIQDISYASGIGFDFVDGKYVAYVQMLDFSTIAKVEGGGRSLSEKTSIWVGEGRGDTLLEAIGDLYRSSPLRIFYGQLDVIIVHDNIIRNDKVWIVHDLLKRYYEFRYTPWVFGTKKDIRELFSITPMFNMAQTATKLHKPNDSYEQFSEIEPKTVRQIVADYREPGLTAMLPSLTVSDSNWYSGTKPHTEMSIDGIYVFDRQQFLGWLSSDELPGIQWINPKTNRHYLLLKSEGELQVSFFYESPKITISHRIVGGKPKYTYKVELEGYISELIKEMPEEVMIQRSEEQIEKEIRATFEAGLKHQADLLGLRNELYRKNNREWQELQRKGLLYLTEDSLEKVEVKVHLNHSGMFKMKGMNKLK